MRRIERLINLIAALLDADRPMTAEEIRTRIAGYESGSDEAFRRAFERDKADLKALGIPLETREDQFGDAPGYTIPKARYYLPELDLALDELAALRIAADAVLGQGEDAGSGFIKLSVGSEDAPWSGARLTWNADMAAAEPALGSLYQAVSERRRASFGYRSATAETPKRRTVEPYAVLHRKGHWYVVGRDKDAGNLRTFKIARIEGSVDIGTETFAVPEDFDASTHPVGEEKGETATVRFDERVAWWAEQSFPAERIRPGPRGAVDVEVPAASTDALISFALWWGTDAEIIAPPAARRALQQRLGELVDA